jgi:hypothetical protein
MAQPCMQITDGTRHKGRLAEPHPDCLSLPAELAE